MARFGRAYPARARQVGPPSRATHRTVDLGVLALQVEFPAFAVVTPDAQVELGVLDLQVDFPALTITAQRSQTVDLGVLALQVEFPALTVLTPVQPGDSLTAAGQVEWNGTLWGAGTSVAFRAIDGWRSRPGMDNLNVERPSRHGAWGGRKLAQQRLVTLRLQVNSRSDPTLIDSLLDDFDAVTGVADDETELPLVVRLYGSPQLAYGQIVDKDIPIEGDYNVGIVDVSLLIACSDPRRYSLDRYGVTVPVDGSIQLSNAGNAATHPVIRIDGPVVDPVLTNAATGRTLQLSISVPDGERLEIDTDAGTISIGDVNKISALTGSSAPVQDFVLVSGANEITYTATSAGDAGVDFLWRDAWL